MPKQKQKQIAKDYPDMKGWNQEKPLSEKGYGGKEGSILHWATITEKQALWDPNT